MKKFAFLSAFALLLVVASGCQSAGNPSSVTTSPTTASKEALVIELPLTKQTAIQIALHDVGVSNEDVQHLHARRDRDDGEYHYDVDFRHGDYYYAYEINEETGEIMKLDTEYDRKENPQKQITEEEAVEIALANEELSREDVTSLTVEFDAEDYRYEVKFICHGAEHTYEVCAEYGKILDIDKE